MVANASILTGVRFGLRERLLLSFVAISGFAVVAVVVGSYDFYAIGEALNRVTNKSVPRPISPVPFLCCNQRSCKPTLAWSEPRRRQYSIEHVPAKVGTGFAKRTCSNNEIERDDDSR